MVDFPIYRLPLPSATLPGRYPTYLGTIQAVVVVTALLLGNACTVGSAAGEPRDASSGKIRFKASLCYDARSEAVVSLRCPGDARIRTRAAFTGISAITSVGGGSGGGRCAFSPGDCAVHEGRTYRCDGNNQCTVSVAFVQDAVRPLSCGGREGTAAYFQVEYDCLAATGQQIRLENIGLQETARPVPRPDEGSPRGRSPGWTGAGANSTRLDATQQKVTPEGTDSTLMFTIIGAVCGFAVFLGVVGAIVTKLRRRSYGQGPLYGRNGQPRAPPPPLEATMQRSVPSRLSRGSQVSRPDTASQHSRKSSLGIQGDSGLGQAGSDLSVPGSISSLFPKQSLRDLAILKGYPPREVDRSSYRDPHHQPQYATNIEDMHLQ